MWSRLRCIKSENMRRARNSRFRIKFSRKIRRSRWTGGYKTKTEDLRPRNEDVKNVLKSLKNGSNMILDRSRNKEHQDLQLSTNLTRVFVLYITLLKVQNEDPVKIVLKSLEKGSNIILDQSRNKEQQDLQLSTNLTSVFVLYITLAKVQNEDPFKIRIRMLFVCTRMLLVCYSYVSLCTRMFRVL